MRRAKGGERGDRGAYRVVPNVFHEASASLRSPLHARGTDIVPWLLLILCLGSVCLSWRSGVLWLSLSANLR